MANINSKITHFKIIRLPDPNIIESKIGGVDIVLDNLYPIASQSDLSFVKKPLFDELSVSSLFIWKTINEVENIESNNANCFLIWKNQNSLNPASDNYTSTILNTDVLNLLDVLTFNESVETFKIININGPGILSYKNNPVYSGQQFLVQDLYYMNYTPEVSGGGDPYFELTFDINNGINYLMSLSIVSLVEISNTPESISNYNNEYDVNGTTNTYNTINQSFQINFDKAYANSIINLQVDINSPWLSLNDFNNIEISTGSESIEKSENETFNLLISTNYLGVAEMTINNIIVEDTSVDKLGDITLTIIDVNGDVNLVSETKEIILNTNL